VRQELADLAALEMADEVPGERAGVRLRLGHEVLGAVLAHQLDAGLGEHRELLDRHVLDRREDLHVGRVAPGGGDLGADPLEVRADHVGPQSGDQLNHTSPACRPVTPRSRRWEKNSASSEQIVHSSTSWTVSTPARSSWARAIALRSRFRPWRTRSP